MIQLTQCPAWSQSLSGGGNVCTCRKQHHICHTEFKLPVTAPPALPQGIWVSLPKVYSTRGSSHLQILRGFFREAGGVLQGRTGSFWVSFPCSQGGWFMRHSWGCRVSPSHERVCGHRLCCKGGGTVNLQGAKYSRRQWTLAPSSHSPGLMSPRFPEDLTYSPGYSAE